MTKICFPHHICGDFDSLRDAYNTLKNIPYGWDLGTLRDIIIYNTRYRDCLRKYGYNALTDLLFDDGCPIAKDIKTSLYMDTALPEHIKWYDIQCYNIKDKITILGHTFNGLEDIAAHCEMTGRDGCNGLECHAFDEYRTYRDVHIGMIYKNYPVFDCYDACDNRCYRNFIFRKRKEITSKDIEDTFRYVKFKNDFCMVHEEIYASYLPILYYRGDGNYMLLASSCYL